MAAQNEKNVTIIGVGRLGICLALSFERKGYNVIGVDISAPYVDAINNKTLKNSEPRVEEFLQASKNFRATLDIDEAIAHSDKLFVLVDTPSTGGERHYDHSKLCRVLSSLNDRKVENKHIIIGCTVLPGFIHDIGRYLIRDCKNTTLTYNPEFIAQGDIIKGFLNPDMVLIGEGSKEIGDWLEQLYKDTCDNEPTISRMSAESAEITKLAVNCFITTKISYSNMVGDIADRTPGANKYDVLAAVGADSRVGAKCLMPGYGFGGPCFPRDNRALGGYAESLHVEPMICDATDRYNKYHSKLMAEAMLAEDKDEYVFDDVAYKPKCPVPIIEESQKLAVAKIIAKAGKSVTIRDRDFIIRLVQQEFGHLFKYEVVESL